MNIDYEKLQSRYSCKVLSDGLVYPVALISEIHVQTYNMGLTYINENGMRKDGYSLIDTSGGSSSGYDYELRKDDNLLLKSVSKNIDGKYYVGFRKEEVDMLNL
jgi:hypothetical protein